MQEIKSVESADVAGKRVVVRVDLDVLQGDAIQDGRLHAAVPTLRLLKEKGASKITVIGHAGRPHGEVIESFRLAPVEARLRALAPDIEFEVKENLRFDSREEANDPEFAKELAALGDVFVNESFGNAHRAHASTVGITKFLPSYAGLQFAKEVTYIVAARTPPQGSIAVLGGAKFETKRPLIEKLLATYSEVLLGGALGNDVIRARGLPVGNSLVSDEPVPVSIASNDKISTALDAVLKNVDAGAERTALIVDTQDNETIVDIGPGTATAWATKVSEAPFILWNGTMGIYEDGFTIGTDAIARAIAERGMRALVGGGDTVAAIGKIKLDPEKVFVSTGGGSMLELLTNGTLPAIEALKS